jgi:hypothetical protein
VFGGFDSRYVHISLVKYMSWFELQDSNERVVDPTFRTLLGLEDEYEKSRSAGKIGCMNES